MIAVVPHDIEEAYMNQHVALARPVCGFNVSYLAWFLASQENGQKQFTRPQRGATKMGLGLDDIKSVRVPFPSKAEQDEIVSEIDRCFSIADEVEEVVDQSLRQAERLRQSILKQAFEGKLVEQDASDPPASMLLEQIKLEKEKRQAESKSASKKKKKVAVGTSAKKKADRPAGPPKHSVHRRVAGEPAERLLERIKAEKERRGTEAEAARKPRRTPDRKNRQLNLLD